ncbi:glycosyl hydrolase 108 family protein [Hymenobacter lucidus]|uniref:TtsA-like Glycoside hydrolase family 108 domain-containing protein n=1 Tax=Hymenobacter lucidus TaxID=2880930 RepID=A0ABS8AMK5_9BACT|nr:glycosyl hydrolase 108 family protein [Hymenobacter lucidus]MCB2407438.1 hypothetical protein [Hymenobacter lucidus]
MADFSHYYPVLLQNEGGYCNDPNDNGKETYCGISRVKNPTWSSWPNIDSMRLQYYAKHPLPDPHWDGLSAALKADTNLGVAVEHFYQDEYWNSLNLNQVKSQSVANQVADFGVNSGVARSAKTVQYLLQHTFGTPVPVDELSSPAGAAALNAVDAKAFYEQFIAMRRAYYDYLAASFTPAQAQAQPLASWHQFFRQELGAAPDHDKYDRYLAGWLNRTHEPFVA